MSYICAYCDADFSDDVMCPECVRGLQADLDRYNAVWPALGKVQNETLHRWLEEGAPSLYDGRQLAGDISRLTDRLTATLKLAERVLKKTQTTMHAAYRRTHDVTLAKNSPIDKAIEHVLEKMRE